ncbi:MAG TPA: hypothetical protein VNT20_20310 [Flavisolibacter sp.]|jgi:streptogramin lyase|nr:hypothetical protein [Flavisolibacter sp.]
MKRSSLAIGIFCVAIVILSNSCKKEKEQTDISNQFTVTTLAGSGVAGHSDGPAAAAQFDHPHNIAVDGQGNIYVSDLSKYAIRKITKDGVVSTFAGGTRGTADGNGSSAQFIFPGALAVDAQDNIYVADSVRIRKITPAGNVTTVAGANAQFNYLTDIAVDKQGNIFAINNFPFSSEIRKVTPSGEVSTFIDTTQKFSTAGFLSTLHQMAIDASGNIFVARNIFLGYEIYKISPSKTITLMASTPDVMGITVNSATGEVFFSASVISCSSFSSCKNLFQIFTLSSRGKYMLVAGDEQGFANGTGSVARFNVAAGISADARGNFYVADQENNRVRKISRR